MEAFPYIIDKSTKPAIAFGSIMSREVCPYIPPRTSTISYTKSIAAEPKIHSSMCKKFPSKRGFSAFASQTPRIQPLPKQRGAPVGSYLKDSEKLVKESYKPFNRAESLRKESRFATPGPGSYTYHDKLPEFNHCLAFGKRRFIWPATAVFCSTNNYSKCFYCKEQPIGDYFHNFTTKLDICRRCMKKQLANVRQCSTKAPTRMRKLQELREFKPVRYCDFYHNHQTTDMALTVMSRAHLRKKIKLENYLYLYQSVWDKPYKL